jgi:replicative DNA helicase
MDGEGGAEEILDRAEATIFKIAEDRIKAGLLGIKEIVKSSFQTIDRLYERGQRITGLSTGYKDLDDLTSGLQRGDLVVVAGRPSMGKTAFALSVAQKVALQQGLTVGIFSLEMAKEQLLLRLLCSEAQVDSHKLRGGYLGKEDWGKLTIGLGRLAEAPIYIDDTPSVTVMEMGAKARRLKAERGLALLIVDYMQLVSGRGRFENRTQEISSISRGLKALAKELDLPVMAISQLSRAPEMRGRDHRPQLSDLRESGSIEQDADVVLFVFREALYNRDATPEERAKTELIIGKQRNGPIGKVEFIFLDRFTHFELASPTGAGEEPF